jgi:hypothetical protein
MEIHNTTGLYGTIMFHEMPSSEDFPVNPKLLAPTSLQKNDFRPSVDNCELQEQD